MSNGGLFRAICEFPEGRCKPKAALQRLSTCCWGCPLRLVNLPPIVSLPKCQQNGGRTTTMFVAPCRPLHFYLTLLEQLACEQLLFGALQLELGCNTLCRFLLGWTLIILAFGNLACFFFIAASL